MTKIVKTLDTILMAHCSAMICQLVTVSGDAEWPKVADAVIEACTVTPNSRTAAEAGKARRRG